MRLQLNVRGNSDQDTIQSEGKTANIVAIVCGIAGTAVGGGGRDRPHHQRLVGAGQRQRRTAGDDHHRQLRPLGRPWAGGRRHGAEVLSPCGRRTSWPSARCCWARSWRAPAASARRTSPVGFACPDGGPCPDGYHLRPHDPPLRLVLRRQRSWHGWQGRQGRNRRQVVARAAQAACDRIGPCIGAIASCQPSDAGTVRSGLQHGLWRCHDKCSVNTNGELTCNVPTTTHSPGLLGACDSDELWVDADR